jgi:predicted phosphodiesterase
MRYAAISDIHGNLPALEAVLKDAREQKVDEYLLVGDYYEDLPFPNETIRTIQSLKNAHIVRGNKENYLRMIENWDPSMKLLDQFAVLNWNFKTIEPKIKEYLNGLPEDLMISDPAGAIIHIFHSSDHIFKGSKLHGLNSIKYSLCMKESSFTHDEYLEYVNRYLQDDNELNTILTNTPEGIYIFGHSHLQWHVRLAGKLIINPGSCGFSADFDNRAKYTILDSSDGVFKIEERAVEYDVEQTIRQLRESSLYNAAPVWSDIMIEQLKTGRDHVSFFLNALKNFADPLIETKHPFSNQVWRTAAEVWYNDKELFRRK